MEKTPIEDEDIVDRVSVSGTTDSLTLTLMEEVVYLRRELARSIREARRFAIEIARLDHKQT